MLFVHSFIQALGEEESDEEEEDEMGVEPLGSSGAVQSIPKEVRGLSPPRMFRRMLLCELQLQLLPGT